MMKAEPSNSHLFYIASRGGSGNARSPQSVASRVARTNRKLTRQAVFYAP